MNPVGNKAGLAESYMNQGYNCAQSVLLAFSDEIPIPFGEGARIASSFGGGMGHLGEVCGAVSAMSMIEGLKYGPEEPNPEAKKRHYMRIQRLAKEFKDEFDSIVCRDLLTIHANKDDPDNKLVCRGFVRKAADIMEREIETEG